jgi:hypothetical protein
MEQEFTKIALSDPAIKAFFLADSLEQPGSGHHVKAVAKYNQIDTLTLMNEYVKPAQALHTITGVQIAKFFKLFGVAKGYTKATYRNVKDSPHWRTAYAIEPVWFSRMHKTHGPMPLLADATSCRACGLVLPLRNLTIDHQKAQAGGEEAAICRVFRGVGLTVAGPHGAKNNMALGQFATLVGGNSNPPRGSREDRYTLNAAGAIYYSVLKAANQLGELKKACMHHYLNLRPICGPCNSSLGNLNIF